MKSNKCQKSKNSIKNSTLCSCFSNIYMQTKESMTVQVVFAIYIYMCVCTTRPNCNSGDEKVRNYLHRYWVAWQSWRNCCVWSIWEEYSWRRTEGPTLWNCCSLYSKKLCGLCSDHPQTHRSCSGTAAAPTRVTPPLVEEHYHYYYYFGGETLFQDFRINWNIYLQDSNEDQILVKYNGEFCLIVWNNNIYKRGGFLAFKMEKNISIHNIYLRKIK